VCDAATTAPSIHRSDLEVNCRKRNPHRDKDHEDHCHSDSLSKDRWFELNVDQWTVRDLREGGGGPLEDVRLLGKTHVQRASAGCYSPSCSNTIGCPPVSEMMACISADSSTCRLVHLSTSRDTKDHGPLPRCLIVYRS
jgi:hypothetical protein